MKEQGLWLRLATCYARIAGLFASLAFVGLTDGRDHHLEATEGPVVNATPSLFSPAQMKFTAAAYYKRLISAAVCSAAKLVCNVVNIISDIVTGVAIVCPFW